MTTSKMTRDTSYKMSEIIDANQSQKNNEDESISIDGMKEIQIDASNDDTNNHTDNNRNYCDDDDNITDRFNNNINNPPKTNRNKLIIIGMSANSDSRTEEEALGCGINYFLPKPFAYHHLLPLFQRLR